MKIWLGLDSSIQAFGFAVMRQGDRGGPELMRAGVWQTFVDHDEGKLADRQRRIDDLCDRLIDLVDKEQATAVYIEDLALGMKTGRGTAQTMGRVRGIVDMLVRVRRLEYGQIRPDALKKACTGRRDASKEDVRAIISRLYGIAPGADLNATDAVACAHVGAQRFGREVRVSSSVVTFRREADALDVD